ncbi:MAG TPA: poly(R)-hydroxyalkanoic acid synthase subunit PhaE [Rhodanobacter sp.]|nr:poly(R)-hydroxyalkanoic acid synthase subunit PhaE [Rhodanobacter sp.]
MRNYQALGQQSWDAWVRQLQPQAAVNPFFTPPPAPASGSDTLERTLAGLKGYFDWMQGAAAGGAASQPQDWRQQVQQLFGGASQPFAQAFGSIDSADAQGFAQQWQAWMQAAQHSALGDLLQPHGPTPAFGMTREQQMQQQATAEAMLASMQAAARYQALIQRANAQGMERLQNKLSEHAAPGRQIESLKALYDLWVDAAEEAYAEIALSDEFRQVYGEMVNTQMRARQLQQQQTEQMCQQLGMPTRRDVSSLGERLQALRRDLAALKRQMAGHAAPQVAAKNTSSGQPKARPRAAATGKAAVKATSRAPRKTAGKTTSASRAKPAARTSPRKRK